MQTLKNNGLMTAVLALLLSLVSAARLAQAAPSATPVYYQLVLEAAMFPGGNPKEIREIVLDLEQVGDQWGAIYGISRNYNMPFHKGAVKQATISGDTITLQIGTDITPDKWVPGGQGEYTITLKRETDGRLTGTHTGKYNGVAVSGRATGTIYAPQPAADFVPLAPQEHPRLLFRKSDLPALREKAKTPFGQAALKKIEALGTPMAFGVLYQLTGDKAWAAKAHKEAEEYLAGRKPGGDPFVPKKPLWAQLEQCAMVYDLCYDALPEDFKARYRAWIADLAFQVYFAPEALGVTNWHVVSNHVANVYSGITLSALAVFDEPSPAPKEPTPPFLEEVLPPAKDFVPAPGVPVVPLTPGKSPTVWLHTEPLRRATPDDPREVFYGLENIHPKPGTQVKVGDFTLTFNTMAPENKSEADIGGLKVGHLIEAAATAKAKEPFTMVLYTVIEVSEPGQYVVSNPVSRANLAQLALAGKLLAHGQVVKLEKGLYPLMCMVQWRMKWGEIAPSLHPAKPEDIAAWAAKAEQLRTQYQTRLSAYATVLENWKRTAGGNPAFARMLRLARFTSTLHCSDAIGRGGFQAEVGGYSVDASSGHARLWPVYRRVMGYDLTPHHEYPDYIPRKLIGGPQDINGTTHIGGDFFAALFPCIRDEWKPEILAAWHNEMKVTSPADPTPVLDADPIRAFINYPLEMKPVPVGTRLPRVWQAPGLGYYAFRSGWDDKAFIAQVFLKAQMISGWNGENAGTYRLRGLGQNWATGTTDRVRKRENENVVWMPEADLADGACGRLTYFSADDTTMVISVDLNEVYERQGRYWYTRYGHLRMPVVPKAGEELPPPSGITGLRSLAFDYSGLSGSPCLFAVVDRIDGGKGVKRCWLFQPPTSGPAKKGAKSPVSEVVTPSERGFTVKPAGSSATLRGVFAHPADIKISTEPIVYQYVKTWGQNRGQKVTVTISALTVPGEDHFFFVGTVAEGQHPPVRVDGAGLDAVVTVGKRTVKFDGTKILLGGG